jgi:molybdopterin biosynthesis enzyme
MPLFGGNKRLYGWSIKKLGEVFKHGIAIKPGKPTILG